MRKVTAGAAALVLGLACAAPASAQDEECITIEECAIEVVEGAAADPDRFVNETVPAYVESTRSYAEQSANNLVTGAKAPQLECAIQGRWYKTAIDGAEGRGYADCVRVVDGTDVEVLRGQFRTYTATINPHTPGGATLRFDPNATGTAFELIFDGERYQYESMSDLGAAGVGHHLFEWSNNDRDHLTYWAEGDFHLVGAETLDDDPAAPGDYFIDGTFRMDIA